MLYMDHFTLPYDSQNHRISNVIDKSTRAGRWLYRPTGESWNDFTLRNNWYWTMVIPNIVGPSATWREKWIISLTGHSPLQGKTSDLGQRGFFPPLTVGKCSSSGGDGVCSYLTEVSVCRGEGWGEWWWGTHSSHGKKELASLGDLLSAAKGQGEPSNPTFCLEMKSFSTPEEGEGRRGGKRLQGIFLPFPLKQKEKLSSIRPGKEIQNIWWERSSCWRALWG